MLPCLSVIMCLHVLMSRGPWEQGHIKSGIKHVPCKARQSPPFMITAEAKKTERNNTNNKVWVQALGRWDWLVLVWDSSFFMGWVKWQIVTKSLQGQVINLWKAGWPTRKVAYRLWVISELWDACDVCCKLPRVLTKCWFLVKALGLCY